jgi:hypothetical protein
MGDPQPADLALFHYRAQLIPGVPPHDGDTLQLCIDQGRDSYARPPWRLRGVWMPELRQKPYGGQARGYVVDWCTSHAARLLQLEWPFYVVSTLDTKVEPDAVTTFERIVADVWAIDQYPDPALSLNAYMQVIGAQHPEWPRGKGSAASLFRGES